MSESFAPLTLAEIWIYPVKSLGGVRLQETEAWQTGLRFDRHWMIVDENGMFLTQRTNAAMAMIDVSFGKTGLRLSLGTNSKDSTNVPFLPEDPQQILVKVWDDTVLARTVCSTADNWLSEKLLKNVRIVEMTEHSERYLDPRYANTPTQLSFADDFPYLLTTRASLDDLNSRLENSVQMARFRPNFVVTGALAFEEDTWRHIRIGDLEFKVSKSCDRCILINIDPFTAAKGREPLKTLATYRKVNKRIYFGRNLTASDYGIIKEGDEIKVLETATPEIFAL